MTDNQAVIPTSHLLISSPRPASTAELEALIASEDRSLESLTQDHARLEQKLTRQASKLAKARAARAELEVRLEAAAQAPPPDAPRRGAVIQRAAESEARRVNSEIRQIKAQCELVKEEIRELRAQAREANRKREIEERFAFARQDSDQFVLGPASPAAGSLLWQ
jgi:DNA repair exonuclease SbcCD ATPase subunit